MPRPDWYGFGEADKVDTELFEWSELPPSGQDVFQEVGKADIGTFGNFDFREVYIDIVLGLGFQEVYTGIFRELDFQVYTEIGRSLGVRKVDLYVLRVGFACGGIDESRRQDYLGEGIGPLRGTSIHLHILRRTGLVTKKIFYNMWGEQH